MATPAVYDTRMFLEFFLHDPFDNTFWSSDVDFNQTHFFVASDLTVASMTGRHCLTVEALPIVDRDQLEEFAEEILFQAAALNPESSLDVVKMRYDSLELDVPLGCVFRVRGRDVVLPAPEYLGRYFTNNRGGANLMLFNARAVIPLRGSKRAAS